MLRSQIINSSIVLTVLLFLVEDQRLSLVKAALPSEEDAFCSKIICSSALAAITIQVTPRRIWLQLEWDRLMYRSSTIQLRLMPAQQSEERIYLLVMVFPMKEPFSQC